MTNILLVDDDTELTEMLSEYLDHEGFDVHAVHDGMVGEQEALSGEHDIIVLDVMLPGLSGIEVLRRVRSQSNVPILLLTARGDDIDKISGLDLGADDYIPKPCNPGELVARLRAIMRRIGPAKGAVTQEETIATGDLVLWPGTRKAEWRAKPMDLTGTEFSLLEVLARAPGRVVEKEVLSQEGLGRPLAPFDRSIDVHISSIRQKLGPRSNGESWILAVRGRGYQLVNE